jgi:hypothetical protein
MEAGQVRVFLDTNIVWYVDWLGPYIFDGDDDVLRSPRFRGAKARDQREWLALAELFRWAQVTSPTFLITQTVVSELAGRRRPYGWELYLWSIENDPLLDDVTPSEADYGLLSTLPNHEIMEFLPDSPDRRLLAEASFCLSDYFLTMDRRTILRHRDKVRAILGIEVILPSELATLVLRRSHRCPVIADG